MYAVVETGGKQYRAAPGEFVDVERLPAEVGEKVTVGRPNVEGAEVIATVMAQRRHRKVLYFHYVPKKRERKKHGHRQYYTRLRIEQIVGRDGED
jgi:large subunit ribosomal protein L21